MTAQRIWIACLVALAAAPSICMAQNPFVGTWKLDPAKSRLTGAVIVFGPAAEQSIQLTAGGQIYSFRADGNLYRMASGDLASWKQIGADSWSTAYETPGGKLFSSETWTLSADGNLLTAATAAVGPRGDRVPDETVYYARTAGAANSTGSPTRSILGTWKSRKVELGAARELVIEANGLGGMILKFPFRQMTCFVGMEGKDAVPEGPAVPPGMTVALQRSGPSSFHWTEKSNGSPIYTSVFTRAADGRSLTEVGGARGDPPLKVVWELQ